MGKDPDREAAIVEKLKKCTGFEWDDGNRTKNWLSHGVSEIEAEEVFVSSPLIFFDDQVHSTREARYAVLGKTKGNRLLTVVFTIRRAKLRVISARPMSRKDRMTYGS